MLEALGALAHRQAAQIGVQAQVLLYGQVLVETEALGHVADRCVEPLGMLRRVEAENLERSLLGYDEASHDPDERRLACPVGSDNPRDRGSGNSARDRVERGWSGAEAFGQAIDADERIGHFSDSLAGARRNVNGDGHSLAKPGIDVVDDDPEPVDKVGP